MQEDKERRDQWPVANIVTGRVFPGVKMFLECCGEIITCYPVLGAAPYHLLLEILIDRPLPLLPAPGRSPRSCKRKTDQWSLERGLQRDRSDFSGSTPEMRETILLLHCKN